ncbi:hypothetical protein QBC37DRAFT_370132 [Rhypophila decipiens]|uniref:Uncharacterized protein n=1 Tax=Rhypophila decipiens TaxID=261697 RepID=A0AAN6YEL7_9PEZI|nr:hypothetical protein QBC37DRAFT_370132 [Rhypophila decipiens]
MSRSIPVNISAALAGDENEMLNGIWIGLMSVEALMVAGVALRGLIKAVMSCSRRPGRLISR